MSNSGSASCPARRVHAGGVGGRLADWLAGRLAAVPLPVPPVARRPVYSTWYTFTQDLDQERVAAETALAAQLGCGSVFVDDGWQRLAVGRGYAGCGDWVPDTAKFADLIAFSAEVHIRGRAWCCGSRRCCWGATPRSSPPRPVRPARGRSTALPHPRPPHREVREHLADTCPRLVVDYDLDGLKIDFLDLAMVYRGTPSSGDIDDVGEAMQALLALSASGSTRRPRRRGRGVPAAVREPGHRRVRADPASQRLPRRRRGQPANDIDARLLAVGQVVHGDMLMWGPRGGPEAVAQQLYACWFAVPQISMALATLADEQAEALAGLLALWQDLAPVVLDGTLDVRGSERAYDLVRADRVDLGRSVIARYAPVVVDLDLPVR